MANKTFALFLLLSALGMGACAGRNKPVVGLDVDLYLHPEAAQGDDLILQTAIQKELATNPATLEGVLHVRVVDGIIFLSGTVKDKEMKSAVEDLVVKTEVTVNGRPIKTTGPVKSRIEVGPSI